MELLTRPVQVMFMSWGRHSGWHWMHSDFSTNSLGSLGEEHSELSMHAIPRVAVTISSNANDLARKFRGILRKGKDRVRMLT